jgi:hypothetical protein
MKQLEASALTQVQAVVIGSLSGLGGGFIGGLLPSIIQRCVPPKNVNLPNSWIPASLFCYAVALASAWAVSWPDPFAGGITEIIAAATAGSLASLTQIAVLRIPSRGGAMWLLLAAPAWAIAVAAPLLIHLPFVGESMGGAVVAVLAFAGLALVFPPNHSLERTQPGRDIMSNVD